MDELYDLNFEDRLAQIIMSIIYSSCHIEITNKLDYADNEIKKGNPKSEAIKKRKEQLVDNYNNAVTSIGEPIKYQGIVTGEIQAKPEVLIRMVDNPPIIQSEINMDTTAVLIVQDTIYVACNFKRRRCATQLPLNTKNFDYIDFGYFPCESLQLLVSALREELADTCVHGTGYAGEKARAIRYCKFIGPSINPENQVANATAHAEMQILHYCHNSIKFNPNFSLGVSRPCCPKCSEILTNFNVKFTRRHAVHPVNWSPPSEISTKILHTLYI